MKAHGTGNHFVLLPDRDNALTLDAALTRSLCDARTGLGGDGAIRIGTPTEATDADVVMDYRNADGSLAEMCGNGVRCVAKVVLDRGWLAGDRVRVDTRGGVKDVEVVSRDDDGAVATVRVAMGAPTIGDPVDLDISPMVGGDGVPAPLGATAPDVVTAEHRLLRLTTVRLGNPHAVAVVDDVARVPLARWAQLAGDQPAFLGGVNVEVVAVTGRATVDARIHERGVGETAASGTGACAVAVAACHLGLTGPRVTVRLPGGNLDCDWSADGVDLVGPAEIVAGGHLDPGWLGARTGPHADPAAPAAP